MANSRFSLLITLGFLILAHGADYASRGVEQTTQGKKDLLSIILPPDLASAGARASETENRTSDLLDGIIHAIFNERRSPLHESSPTPTKGNGNFHSIQSDDFNAGNAPVKVTTAAPSEVNGKSNQHAVSGDTNVSNSNYVSGNVKGNSSVGVPSESEVHFPGEVSSKVPEASEEVSVINRYPNDGLHKSNGSAIGETSDKKSGKSSKENKDAPKIEVEFYHIIGAPIRQSDDQLIHGCKNGQKLSFGHCRDILD